MKDLAHRQDHWSLESPLFPRHMSFLVGPRQCGKTTLAMTYLQARGFSPRDYYFNWDRADVRQRFREDINWLSALKVHGKRPPLIFDEIHKVRQWKRLLKGVYDQYRDDFQFIVTGSGRLDHFQRGGDSLAGRFDSYFLMPFTPGEIAGVEPIKALSLKGLQQAKSVSESVISQWEVTGGFPEAFLSGSELKAKAWWKNYKQRVSEEDFRDLTRLESADLMRQMIDLLPSRVSAPLSIQSVREDLETSFATAKRYISTLNQLYLTFDVAPYSKRIHRAIKKEKKLYFFHHPCVLDPGARHENMVALVLKRWIHEQNEKAEGDYELNYLRDQDRREVDFIILKDRAPVLLVEAKLSDLNASASLRYYSEKLKIPGIQVIRPSGVFSLKDPHLATVSLGHLAGALG